MLRLSRVSTVKPPPRPAAALLVTMLVFAVLPGLSCRATTAGIRPATAILSPEWDSLNIQSLGFVTVGSSVGDEVARQMVEGILEGQLSSNQDRFVVLGVQTARARAAAAGAGDVFDRLVKVWHDERVADKFLVESLCTKMGVDGLLFGELSDWKREKVGVTEEGSSFTQVEMRLVILSGKTGMIVWEAQKMIRQDTQLYTPGGDDTGVASDNEASARDRRLGGLAPEPPRPEDLVVDVLASIMAAFSPRPTK
jgi:hypothetical protein